MIDSSDIIFDEDFGSDIEDKEEIYFSQIITSEKETPLKRRKLSPEKSICTLSSSSSSLSSSSGVSGNKNTTTNSKELSNRKNRVLNIFASRDSQEFEMNIKNHNEQQQQITKKQYQTSTQKNYEKESTKLELTSKQKTSNKIKNIKAFLNNQHDINKSITHRKNYINIKKNLEFKLSVNQNNIAKSPPQELQAMKRRFPGPAGLLPDTLNDSTKNLNYLHIRDANKTKNSTKDFCTQDTKELFSHGAWQIMMNDLPKNLLQNHDIMSTKLSGVETVSILAGVIQKIDYNTEAPRVILKDISDTIEGLMSRDVPVKFPNILQPGVVIILRGANCFTFKGKNWRRNKTLMITTKSLIGIYGENSRLASTPILDAILKSNSIDDDDDDDNDNDSNEFNDEIIENIFDENEEDLNDCDKNSLDDLQIIKNSNDKNLSDILNQSKNKNTLISSVISKEKSIVNNWSSSFSNELFLNNESDDELFTQIDIDAIAEAYNSKK